MFFSRSGVGIAAWVVLSFCVTSGVLFSCAFLCGERMWQKGLSSEGLKSLHTEISKAGFAFAMATLGVLIISWIIRLGECTYLA